MIASAILLASCGVGTEGGASTSKGDEVPYGLLDATVGGPTTTLPEVASRAVQVWLVAEGRILALTKEVAAPVGLGRVLDALLAGPNEGEASLGVRSALPADDVVVRADLDGDVATIELARSFVESAPREQLLALAQLVYTATELPTVRAVSFELDGLPIDVPRADGSVTARPVSRRDYASLAAS